jgi:hypothetical protein
LALALFSAGVPFILRASVPSLPTIGSVASNLAAWRGSDAMRVRMRAIVSAVT